jgi:adenylate cyclase
MAEDSKKTVTFWAELRRRKVVRVIIAYLLVGWGLIQIADATIEPLRLPEWSYTLVVWLVGLGFPIAIVLAWVLDITPRGIEVTAAIKENETPSPPDASIAVLPFVNMSGNAENEYFSDGLSEELLNLMVRLQSVRVCSRTSSFALKGKDVDMPTIAAQLGVRHVLEGSVRRVGSRVRITAQLIDAVEDCHLWSESFDRELDDIFAVQDEIAAHIFKSLQLTLTADEQQASKSTTDNVEALDFYLRGRELYHRTEDGHLDKAREMFEEAIRIDPNYALAWAGLTYVFVDTYWYRNKEEMWVNRAHETSRKAVELAPHLAESHGARGLALRADERFEEAEEEFEKAIAINARLFEPLHFYAQMMRSTGQYERSAVLFRRAGEVRPEDYQTISIASLMYEMLDDEDQAQAMRIETIERAKRAIELNPNDSRAIIMMGIILVKMGQVEESLSLAKKAIELNPKSGSIWYNTACIYVEIGRVDESLDYLERAVELGARNKRYYENDSDLDPLRDHPRFKALMERI